MNKVLNLIAFVALIAFMPFPAAAADDCVDFQAVVESKTSTYKKQIESIKSLMGLGGESNHPIDLLFQVDLKQPEQISRRLQEIRKLTEVADILESGELRKLTKCPLDDAKRQDLNSLAGLISELNLLKVRFFELPSDKRSILVENYSAQRSLRADQILVNKEVERAESALDLAQKKLSEATASTDDQNRELQDDDLAVAVATLQQYLADTANDHLAFLKQINDKKIALEEIRKELNVVLKAEQDSDDLKQLLTSTNYTWEKTVDYISGLFSGLQISTSIPMPEPIPPKPAYNEQQAEGYSQYVNDYSAAQKGRLEQTRKRTQIVDDLRSQAFHLLSDAGKLRSRLYSRCDNAGNCDNYRNLNARNISDMAREIEIIPIKVRAGSVAKYLEMKGKVHAGVDGWIDLSQQFIAFFILLLIPLFLFKLLSWFNLKLDSTRKAILARSMMDFRKRTSLALWIARINPFLPAAGMVIGIWVARNIVETTDLNELSQILFYLQLYFIYRIFKLFIQIALEVLFSSDSVADRRDQKELVEKSARRISRLIFIEYAFLHLIETSVRKALLYGVISSFISYFNVVFVFWECFRWRNQVVSSYLDRFPKHQGYLHKVTSSTAGLFLVGPLLLGVVAVHDVSHFVYSRLIRMDFFKKIHSEIFRRRIESDSEGEQKTAPSTEYLQKFDYYLPADPSIFVNRQNSPSSIAAQTIKLWMSGQTSEDLILIVGNRGMGKTTTLDAIAKSLDRGHVVHRPSPKTLEDVPFFEFLSGALGAEVKNVDDILRIDGQLHEKRVVIIDDIQNLFLGKIGGFEIYKVFVEILSLKTRNLFWCVSVNSRSWSYLRGALGKEHLYGKVLDLLPWKDFEIQELITKRHDLSGFRRQFHQSIKAYGAGGDALGQHAETQFFRLLWGQSRGNPRSALMYWISAISQTEKDKVVVGVPSFVSSSLVGTMSDDSLFLLASIARHESLTQAEMQSVTNIQSTVIRKCMKEALDKNLVWSDSSGRYRISSRAQYVVDYFLIGKNFLYE